VLLVLLAADSSTIVWRSNSTMADVRDWQPFIPGDPTFSALEHILTLTTDETVPETVCRAAGGGGGGGGGDAESSLQQGMVRPEARGEKLAAPAARAEAFSVRLANVDVGWVPVKGEGAVNVLANVTCA
jgi:hypothetical protein